MSSDGGSQHDFLRRLDFEPDRFQLDAFDALDDGAHVIVAAPTGAGKTLVAAYAVERAITAGTRVFYTTPIKALSNQKFHDLVADYGARNVGLLTGDNSINGDASVVVMTTEVLRNMLYGGRPIERLDAVILDEVHYLQDSYRGPVWEEVIIHLPREVQLVALSATVSNAEELAEWMETVRGPTRLVVELRRPVELENLYLVGERRSDNLHLIKTLHGGKANSKGFRYDAEILAVGQRRGSRRSGPKGKRTSRPKWATPSRLDVVRTLRERELLPAIHFIFSRAACTDAARAVHDAGMVLTTERERSEIRAIAADRIASLSAEDLKMLEYERFLAGLEAGVAPHHAGMVPPLKETVEACFVRGLTKVVFATETLALGINMPAKTVVLDKLTKYTGEHHEALSPAQYTQLTGRAGRRGIDRHGQAVVLWSPFVRFEQVATLAASREFVLRSAFRPTYNMAANLVRRYEQPRARQLLNLSFAQFRADADIVRGEHHLERLLDRRRQIEGRIEREFGPLDELQAALATTVREDRDVQDIQFALSQVRPGDVLAVEGIDDGPRPITMPSPVVALSVAYRKGRRVKVVAADAEADTYEITADLLDSPPIVVGSVELPEPYLPQSMTFVYDASQALKRAQILSKKRQRTLGPTGVIRSVDDVPAGARRGLRRLEKINKEIEAVRRSMVDRTASLGLQFDRVVALLEDRGHLDGWALTDSGQRLARLYHESDLFLVEALDAGLFDGLEPAEVAAMTSAVIFEDRRSSPPAAPWFPTPELRRRFGTLTKMHRDLVRQERRSQLPETRPPDPGFMAIAHGWAAGGGLDDVLADEEITAGDFVRTAKLLIDLLRQIATLAAVPDTGRAAARAADGVFRDLVAASSIVEVGDEDEVADDEIDEDSDLTERNTEAVIDADRQG